MTIERLHRIVAGLVPGLVLVMAAIAGRHLYGFGDIDVHGHLGNAVFVLVLAGFALTLAARRPRRDAVVAALIVVLVFAQTGIGYVGRTSLDASAWHIPLGVFIMGLSMYQYAEVRRPVISAGASRT